MKAQQKVFDFLKTSLGYSSLLAVAGDLVPFSNDSFDNARFLSQLIFWTDDREEFEPIPTKRWKDVAKLSRYAVDKARYFFSCMGILETRVFKDIHGNPTVHYKLDFKVLMQKLIEFFKDKIKDGLLSGFAEISNSISGQNKSDSRTKTKLHNKSNSINKNIGHKNKKENKMERKAYFEKFYIL